MEVADLQGKRSFVPVQPGLSFFEREDQQDLFKLHLPYVWRTPPEVDLLFVSAINRSAQGLIVLAGLVETDWYAHPVNLVMRKPAANQSVHIMTGEPIAQAIFVARSNRRPTLQVLASHARAARDFRTQLVGWYQQHAEDRSAYKKLARSHHGKISMETSS
jgi:hypothetical protein